MSTRPRIGSDSPGIEVTPCAPDEDLVQLLVEHDASVPVLVLPRAVDGDMGIYRETDLAAVKRLRLQGVPIDFLHPAAQRTFQGEYSAEFVVFLLIFVAHALGEQAIQALASTFHLAGR